MPLPPHQPPDPLDPLFSQWRESVPEPSDQLESRVWRRLAAVEQAPAARGGLLAGIEAMFARTSFTAAFVAACILLGLFLAETRASRLQTKRSGEFVLSYLRQIDPQFDHVAPLEASTPSRP